MSQRAMFKGVINLIIKQDDKVLLFFRNDGFFNYDGGWWVLPAGHIEQGETARDAAIREAKEELDINIAPEDIKLVHVASNLASRTESFDFYFEVSRYTGEIRNCESGKCVEMRYFTLDEVAKLKNVISPTRVSLACLKHGEIYSELKSYQSEQNQK
jgi:8-oxo-dGTP pyrophosphatase MutT (NUDIX family)